MRTKNALLSLVILTAAACGGEAQKPAKTPDGAQVKNSNNELVNQAAADKFKAGQEAALQHDKARDWTDATCQSTAELFLGAAKEQDKFAEAYYSAALAWERCAKHDEAKKNFAKAIELNPKFHQARTKLALMAYTESGEKKHDEAIAELRKAAIEDAKFQNVEALVHLGMVYLKRGNMAQNQDGPNDLAAAKRFAQSALAVDDGYMPAFNLLALIYLESAKVKAGKGKTKVATGAAKAKEKKLDTQALELAALVCSQAIRKNANYAPIHNTAGMIQVELNNLNSAVQEFNVARKLDPSFYEAQMNFAAVNLQFRGFAQAQDAYQAVLKLHPRDYDARLGLALALRGQIDDTNFDKQVAATSAELEEAKKIAPDRAETYYNDAILTQEYKAKSGGPSAEPALVKAKELFGTFVQKAGSAAEFAEAVKRAKERMGEIDQIIAFNKQTEAERKAAEAEAKNKAAQDEAAAAAEGDTPKEEPPKP